MNTSPLYLPLKRTALSATLLLSLGSGMAHAVQQSYAIFTPTSGGNFSMLSPQGSGATGANPTYNPNATSGPNSDPYIRGGAGYVFGGTNNVTFTWDGTVFNDSADYTGITSVSNATISSPTTFFSQKWTAHHVQIFGPGTYTFDTAAYNGGANSESGTMTMTVGPGQLGAHMLFDWNGNLGIDVVNVWNVSPDKTNATGGLTFSSCGDSTGTDAYAANCLWTGTTNAVGNTASTTWLFASTDDDSDGTLGIPMAAGGPFQGNNANFNLKGSFVLVDSTPETTTTFTDQTGVAVSSLITSNAVTVGGINVAVAASVSAGSEYEINNSGIWNNSTIIGSVSDTNTVRVRHTSSACAGTQTTTTLTIGNVTRDFISTTTGTGTGMFPNTYAFTAQPGVNPGIVVSSGPVTITGLTAAADISVTNGEYRINGGTWSAADASAANAVNNNDTVEVRHTASASYTSTVTTTLNIGESMNACTGLPNWRTATFDSTTRAQDTIPNTFIFTSKTNQPTSTLVISDPITVTGLLDAASITISGATGSEYEINNSGNWVGIGAPAGTVNNNDTVRIRHTTSAMGGSNTVTSIAIGGVPGSFTSTTTGTAGGGGGGGSSNFTMLDAGNGIVGGTNDVTFTWNGTFNTDPATALVNATIASGQPFFGYKWKAYQVKIYGPGTYTISTADTMGSLGCPDPAIDRPVCASGGDYVVTVATGQIMAHMKFAWSTSQGIDVINVWDTNAVFGPSTLYQGANGYNAANTVWNLMSSDVDGNGMNGLAMIDGPFKDFSANFNIRTTGSGTSQAVDKVLYDATEPSGMPDRKGWCSISTSPVNPMERGDWWLVAGFLGWLAMVRRRLGRSSNP